MQEESQALLGDAGLLAESLPVTIAALVQGDDEVEDGLRLRRHLSQSDTLAGKRSSGPSVSDVRILPRIEQWLMRGRSKNASWRRLSQRKDITHLKGVKWAKVSVEQTHLLM